MAKDFEDLSMKDILTSIKTDILKSPYNKFDVDNRSEDDNESDINDEEVMNLLDEDDSIDVNVDDDEPLDLTDEITEENSDTDNENYDFREITKSISNSMNKSNNNNERKSVDTKPSKPQPQKSNKKKSSKSTVSNQNDEIDKFLEMIKSSDKTLSFNENNDTADDSTETDESLISKATENKSLRSIEKIISTKKKMQDEEERAQMRMRTTIDDLALAALTPMLKQWIDANLNRIVEEVIQKEIEKLIDKASNK